MRWYYEVRQSSSSTLSKQNDIFDISARNAHFDLCDGSAHATISPPAMLTGQIKCKTPMCQGRLRDERHFSWETSLLIAAITHTRPRALHTHVVLYYRWLEFSGRPSNSLLHFPRLLSPHILSLSELNDNAQCEICMISLYIADWESAERKKWRRLRSAYTYVLLWSLPKSATHAFNY